MIKKFKELTLGKVVVQERTYAGLVEFEVVKASPELVTVKSTSIHGYSSELTPETLNKYNQNENYWFESVEEASAYKQNEDTKRLNTIVAKYTADKDLFIAEMINLAFRSERDPEYGDYVHSDAIKKAASVLFPDLNLD